MKTAELTGALLDYWVARANGDGAKIEDSICWRFESDQEHGDGCGFFSFDPSTDWAQGGPIIGQEKISFVLTDWADDADRYWAGYQPCLQSMTGMAYDGVTGTGPTPLVAAMRAFVANKFGDDVHDPL